MVESLVTLRESGRHSQDPRVVRTRQAVLSTTRALISAGRTSPTVADVARAAGVSRASFYTHFASIDEAVIEALRESFARIRKRYEHARVEDVPYQSMVISQIELVDAVDAERQLLGHRAGTAIHEELAAGMAEEIRETLQRTAILPDGLDPILTANYIASAAVGLLLSWVRGAVVADKQQMVDHLMRLMPAWLSSPPRHTPAVPPK